MLHRLHPGKVAERNQHPSTIARCLNRDKRNINCRHTTKPRGKPGSSSSVLFPGDFAIHENLTKVRKFLFSKAYKIKQELNYDNL